MQVLIMFCALFVIIFGGISIVCIIASKDKYYQLINNKDDIAIQDCLVQCLAKGTRYVIENGKITYIQYKA